jgi:serine/threonine protein phosphatase 1
MRTLPLYFEVGDFVFVHAGANVQKPIQENTENETVWMNESFPWCPAYPTKTIIFGHTPTWQFGNYNKITKQVKQNAKIWYDRVNKDKIAIDCGGCFGGRLAVLELPSYREFYV